MQRMVEVLRAMAEGAPVQCPGATKNATDNTFGVPVKIEPADEGRTRGIVITLASGVQTYVNPGLLS